MNIYIDFAVEDSPAAFTHLLHHPNCTAAVFARPWNQLAVLPNEHYVRCLNWQEIDQLLMHCVQQKADSLCSWDDSQ